ncbi:hypothetical protein Taro_021932 [Colocasia esculenta]|uniref:Uncharacterized protein n=1 Tax=Colocasia esculenta TaxID=4460 RepID=A0A843V9S0_COLES|nr:hypothetical protein [Colocasia esculenta]
MADRRDWGGGGDDPEESTQRMIERIWESLTDIRARMDQQAPVPLVAVPPGDGEVVHVAPVLPRVEVRARRTFLDRRPVQSRAVAVQGRYLQLRSSSPSSVVLCSLVSCLFSSVVPRGMPQALVLLFSFCGNLAM